MVSEATEQSYRYWTKQTAEGEAFYPAGTWGAGYIVDARTEASIKRFLDRQTWVVMAALMVIMPLPLHFVFRMLLGAAAINAALYLGPRYILRHGRRTDVRLTRDDLERRQVALLEYHHLYRAAVLFLAMMALFIGGAILASSSTDRWLFASAGLVTVVYCGSSALRLRRARTRLGRPR